MYTPEEIEEQNMDDRDISHSDDQQSQLDVHSNGYEPKTNEEKEISSKDLLDQAYRSSESSFTLEP
ncbi:hypothetical protein ACJVDH_08370 [Pedobacter sp. AW1-32]|uniref:hypothetical protein n=1 Tax=Pedobacter sp. AW1-32 TaxID=3383026 RepID=UPI003FEDB28C